MDDVELGRILGEHGARLDTLEAGHAEHHEAIETHDDEIGQVQSSADGAFNAALSVGDGVRADVQEQVREVEAEVVQVKAQVAEVVATEVAEDIVEDAEAAEDEGEVNEIVEGEKTEATAEPEKSAEPEKKAKRHKPYGKN